MECIKVLQDPGDSSIFRVFLTSIKWLNNQFGLGIDVSQTSTICSSTTGINCQVADDDNAYHVVSIYIGQQTVFVNSGEQVDTTLKSLNLPFVQSITATFSGLVQNFSINTLDMISNMPRLEFLTLSNDKTIDIVPTNFPNNLPSLKTITFYLLSNLTSIPNFFNNSISLNSITMYQNNIEWVGIDKSIRLPNIASISIQVKNSKNMTLIIDPISFPSLKLFEMTSNDFIGTSNIRIIIKVALENIGAYAFSGTGSINPTISYPLSLRGLSVGGKGMDFQPNDLTLYKNLETLQIYQTNLTSMPISSFGKITSFRLSDSKLQQFPNIPFPNGMNDVNYQNNQMSGTIPSGLLINNQLGLSLSLIGNQNIVGSAPNDTCFLNSFSIDNTGIDSLPDCWWCFYEQVINTKLSTQLTKPIGFECLAIKIDQLNLNSIGGVFTISGSNIGWNINSGGRRLIEPNRKIEFQMDLSLGTKQQRLINLINPPPTSAYSFNFIVTEVGFNVESVKIINQNLAILELNCTFEMINPDFLPTVIYTSQDHVPCDIINYNNSTKSLNCLLRTLPIIGQQQIIFKNQFFNQSFMFIYNRDPIITSLLMEPNYYPPTFLNLYGYFGNTTGASVILQLREFTFCNITIASKEYIKCRFYTLPEPGPQTLYFASNQGYFKSDSILSIPFPLPTFTDCMNRTNNCNGHGVCINGICQCDVGYFDDCKLKENDGFNGQFQSNNTDPTSNLKYGDYLFSFSIIGIQEMDLDNNITRELVAKTWDVEDNSSGDLTMIQYKLTNHLHNITNGSTPFTKDADYSNLNLTTTIEFSNQSRTIEFGGDEIVLASGAIKIGVNVTNWPYMSVMTRLRLVFSTTINNQQMIVGCDNSSYSIESLQNFADRDSIQYLRVLKDNVQFFGRFLDYSLSDGRKTYSKTEVLNITRINDEESNVIIGINIGQCKICLMDPDFSALLIDHKSFGQCNDESKNDNWKLIVGVVVGTVGGTCLIIISILFIKSNKYYFIHRAKRRLSISLKKKRNRKRKRKRKRKRITAIALPGVIKSIQWVIQQYQSTIGLDQTSICSSGQVKCTNYQDVDIYIQSVYVNSGAPPNIDTFEFPNLLTFTLSTSGAPFYSNSFDILSKMKGLPLVESIKLIGDNTIKSIPIDFTAGKPLLRKLWISSVNLVSAGNIFSHNLLNEINFSITSLNSVRFNTTVYMPDLKTLILDIKCDYASNWEISSSSFPTLYSLIISASSTCNQPIIVNVTAPLRLIECSNQPVGSPTGYIKMIIQHPLNVTSLGVGGYYSTLPDLTIFPNINSFYMSNSQISDISSIKYPLGLMQFQLSYSKIMTIPNVPLPKTLTSFDMSSNLLTSTVPAILMDNNPSTYITFGNNLGLTGSIPESFCSARFLSIPQTGITTVPNCFWCYTGNLLSDLTKPNNIDCQPIIDNFNLISLIGGYEVRGQLLGWGKDIPNMILAIQPNKILRFTMDLANGMNQNITIKFSPTSPSFVFFVQESYFIVQDIKNIQQTVNYLSLNITFATVNPELMPRISVGGSVCELIKFYPVEKVIQCAATFSSYNNNNTIYFTNDYYNFTTTYNKATYVETISLEPLIYPPKYLILNGYFGTGLSLGYISIRNGTLPSFGCTILNGTLYYIKCEFPNQPPSGQTVLNVDVPNGLYQTSISIPFAQPTNDDCMNRTNNCNNHGTCVNGQCVCDPGYFDNCKLKTDPNIEIEPNNQEPSFSFKDYSFSFKMIAIQELDIENNVVRNLNTTKWNVSESQKIDYSSINYFLTNHLNNSQEGFIPQLINTNVTSIFEISNQSRTIKFGGQSIQLASGSIKISVNVTNWPFTSVLTRLRVVFSTIVNNQQAIVGCDDSVNQIESFQQFTDSDSIQYLRVVKNNTQFFGRFLDYSVADGRNTYSKAEVLNITKIDNQESQAILGINIGQCRTCLLDPDFSALLIDRQSYGQDCTSNSPDNNWKIIVGVVVGAVGAAILIAVAIFIKQNRYFFLRRNNETKIEMN
ncbi:hypothetical protein DFA_02468 [Cavenderia fasciculata]|uniref:EGF-like domain-containing protein n=1 Tax=Cavenderia fasciculata TaxID=261658 RepID=F4PZJ1_CACFS|nr:uncharacterized protein DFA_02468 [Cavenderia fasciculata]EGG19220.1 hypothetical protein DFA_02468 [Cavenderia fasciculata]|eukprot:XP_004366853.1 hypothetical protein DFA_02468 [Cavenderia fasciculata]